MPFPTYDDAVDVAQLQAAVAEMLSQRVKSGVVSVTFATSTSHTQTVSFATPFASAPRVTTNIASGAGPAGGWISKPTNVTASGFTLLVSGTSSAWSGINVHWIATDLPNA